jgi:hypothetical protein
LRKRRPSISRNAVARYLSPLIFLCLIALSPAQEAAPDLGRLSIGSWKTAGPPEIYKKEGLFGYIDGGAELFLQYGFEELTITRYVEGSNPSAEKETTVEVYRMASPADAFGIFSLKREGDEPVSQEIESVHWLSASQASLAKGNFYININGVNTAEQEMEAFAAAVSRKIEAASALPDEISLLPSSGRIIGSERYIRGGLAAEGESLLLDREFWGFEKGAVAVSAKYRPSRSKLLIIVLKAPVPGLAEEVKKLFSEYLEEVAAKDGLLRGKNAAGRWFLFRPAGDRAFLMLGEPDYAAAERLIGDAAQK